MKEIESNIKAYLLNKKITNLKFYNINGLYVDLGQKSMWIIDGGVQVDMGNSVFSFGWNYEQEGYDFVLEKTIDTLLGEAPHYEVDLKENPYIRSLIGSEIIDVELEWGHYQKFDENAQLTDEKIFIPVGLLLKFRFDDSLQFALINYQIQDEPFDIIKPEFDLSGELLISLNKDMRIANADN